jgi:hypothetical protein
MLQIAMWEDEFVEIPINEHFNCSFPLWLYVKVKDWSYILG